MENKITAEEMILMARPFPLEEIFFRPQGFSGNKAQALVHATPRAYHERFNSLFGSDWDTNTDVEIVLNPEEYEAKRYGKMETFNKPTKVITKTTVRVRGVMRSSFGEDYISNENVATTAEAQSEKRAFSKFGCGSYLYDFKNIWWDYTNNKFQDVEGLKAKYFMTVEQRFWDMVEDKGHSLDAVAKLLIEHNLNYKTVGTILVG